MPEESAIQTLEGAIHVIRGQRVMLDADLAEIYGVSTKRLKEQFTRNRKRFPKDFAFVLTREEVMNLRSQFATSSSQPAGNQGVAKLDQGPAGSGGPHGGRRHLPVAFTEHGAIMLASVLSSDTAVEASVRVVRAFVRLREIVAANAGLKSKLAELESRLDGHDETLANLFDAIRLLLDTPKPNKETEMGFHVREAEAKYRVKRRAPKRGSTLSTLNSQLS